MLDASTEAAGGNAFSPWTRARRIPAARRCGHHVALEFPGRTIADAARDRHRGRQSGDDQAVRVHSGNERCSCYDAGRDFPGGASCRGDGRSRCRHGILGAAFDHLVFTGSTSVGKAVMKAASANLVPVTLELGGKSPVIVEKGSSLERAAASIAFGKLSNGGQICVSPDYAFIPENEVNPFLAAYNKAVRSLYPDGPASGDFTSIINERHYGRLHALLDEARAKGAQVIEVGENSEATRMRPHTLPPTVVLGATDDMGILNEEIFGPVLPIVPYRDIDEAIAHINAGPRPLALYFFGGNSEDRRKVLERTTSGNVTINDTLLHYAQDDLQFGGVGPSGMGAYHGIEGFKSLSHAKGIFEQSRWNLTGALRPPFGWLSNFVTRFLLR